MLSVETAWQLAGAVAIVGSAWWAGWYWFRAQEQMRFATRELPRCFLRPDNLLILWFLGLLACGAYSANRTFTFM
jgi:hypothetical protein